MPGGASTTDIWVKIRSVHALANVSESTVKRWLKDGKLPRYSVVLHGDHVTITSNLVRLSDVQKLTGEWKEAE